MDINIAQRYFTDRDRRISMKEKAPALFIGHGSPMNAIEDNSFTQTWSRLGKELPAPEAILVVSAHWFTDGSKISDEIQPRMIYDMYGFPDALYQVKYPAKGRSRACAPDKEPDQS